mmetsp:Transcript_17246/g.50073  ORF Transcript_17246/g.50073 Transcript_17246/m.50073 type:complete len:343 (-) Transcript_17246:13-1041(-)
MKVGRLVRPPGGGTGEIEQPHPLVLRGPPAAAVVHVRVPQVPPVGHLLLVPPQQQLPRLTRPVEPVGQFRGMMQRVVPFLEQKHRVVPLPRLGRVPRRGGMRLHLSHEGRAGGGRHGRQCAVPHSRAGIGPVSVPAHYARTPRRPRAVTDDGRGVPEFRRSEAVRGVIRGGSEGGNGSGRHGRRRRAVRGVGGVARVRQCRRTRNAAGVSPGGGGGVVAVVIVVRTAVFPRSVRYRSRYRCGADDARRGEGQRHGGDGGGGGGGASHSGIVAVMQVSFLRKGFGSGAGRPFASSRGRCQVRSLLAKRATTSQHFIHAACGIAGAFPLLPRRRITFVKKNEML